MLNIRQMKHLHAILKSDLEAVLNSPDEFTSKLIVRRNEKVREVLCVNGSLRNVQRRVLSQLKSKLSPTPYSHGGISGRSPLTNAKQHLKSRFFFQTDVTNFYPSIHHSKVYDLFMRLGCSPDVSSVLTTVCTHDFHLALGMITSPFLADQIFAPIDRWISSACHARGLIYTRFVDDITISGRYNLKRTNVERMVANALSKNGFSMNRSKTGFQSIEDQPSVTGIRMKSKSRLDVRKDFIGSLSLILKDAKSIADGNSPEKGFYTEDQIRGKVQFACWVNPNRTKQLRNKLTSIDWDQFWKSAETLGLFSRIGTHVSRNLH